LGEIGEKVGQGIGENTSQGEQVDPGDKLGEDCEQWRKNTGKGCSKSPQARCSNRSEHNSGNGSKRHDGGPCQVSLLK